MSFLYVSGWFRGKGAGGLGRYSFDDATGEISLLGVTDEDVSFGASLMDDERGILYVIGNNAQDVGLKVPSGGAVWEIHFDKETGEVKDTRIVPLFISNPCNLAISRDGRYMLVVGHGTRNYVSKIVLGEDGEYHPAIETDDVPVMLISMGEDGSVGKILDVVQHTGSGPLPKQQTAHPHCVYESPLYDFFVVCDKGNDSFFSYSIDRENGKLRLNGEPVFTAPAVCPRYAAFHTDRPFVYHNSESSTDIYAYEYDEQGMLKPIGIFKGTQFAEGQEGSTEGQGLNMHPSGKYLYNVTNGTDTVDVFRVNEDGTLEFIQGQPITAKWPRGQVITKDGRFLILSANVGGKIFVFRINEDGTLSDTGFGADHENAESLALWTR